ncbi:MAG: hypothetical protein HC850_06245 [Rhodomicrobium sp.]|nr:hypothetical protein [Rhodomicrobium sp.]
MTAYRRWKLAGLAAGTILAASGAAFAASDASKPIKVTGEIIDTWCYYSGVMGGQDAVVGTAHHTCALWCAAGGIPVGMRTDDGTVYLVLKLEGAAPLANKETLLDLQSNKVTATGLHYVRDGVNYIVVEKVVANEGIVNQTHKDYGPVPSFAVPEPKK